MNGSSPIDVCIKTESEQTEYECLYKHFSYVENEITIHFKSYMCYSAIEPKNCAKI